jgi:hypothetical protein
MVFKLNLRNLKAKAKSAGVVFYQGLAAVSGSSSR